MKRRLKLAILLSGGGSTLHNLIKCREEGRLWADIGLVVSSRPGVRGLDIAAAAGIRSEVVAASQFLDVSAREGERIYDWYRMSDELNKLLLPDKFDLVCMAGFLSRYYIPEDLLGRVINIHPSLIPMFCGQDMYGDRVHRAVVKAGVRVTGCTVHFADNNYDTGPIILQRACPVYSDDGPKDVQARVFLEECKAYPDAINLLANGRVSFRSPGRTYVSGDSDIERFSHDA